jgi:hypothetical protein
MTTTEGYKRKAAAIYSENICALLYCVLVKNKDGSPVTVDQALTFFGIRENASYNLSKDQEEEIIYLREKIHMKYSQIARQLGMSYMSIYAKFNKKNYRKRKKGKSGSGERNKLCETCKGDGCSEGAYKQL